MSTPPLRLSIGVLALALALGLASPPRGQVPPQRDVTGAATKDLAVEGQRRLAHARELIEKGAKDAALAELLWCFDRCRDQRTFWSTRLGAVLDALGALAKVHPAARVELETRRDARERAVRAGALDNDDVAELLALNEVLDDAAASLRTYDAVARNRSAAAMHFFYEGVRLEMWRQRRYRTLVDGRPRPQERLQTAAIALREASKRLVGHELRPDPRFAAGVVADICVDIEARIALADLAGAQALVAATRQFVPEPQTDALLIAHAARAGDDAFVDGLRREAERDLSVDGKAELARAIDAAKAELRRRGKTSAR